MGMPIFIKRVDMFGAPMPVFNIEGSSMLNTNTGGVLTVLIFFITFFFSVVKFGHLVSRSNPSVNNYTEREVYGPEDLFKLVDEEFMIAFSLDDYNTQETKMDTNYVKYFVMYSNLTAGVRQNTEIPLHTCTEEDYARFYPVESRSAKTLNAF